MVINCTYSIFHQEHAAQLFIIPKFSHTIMPTVLTREEILANINHLSGVHKLIIVKLLYGTGLRQTECLQLRIKDIDFTQKQVIVRDGKEMESRATMLPTTIAYCSLALEAFQFWK
jgi:integrase